MAGEELTSIRATIKEERRFFNATRDKLKKLQFKVDELTIARSKEIELPEVSEMPEDIVQMDKAMQLILKDKSQYYRMKHEIDKKKIKLVEQE